VSDHIVELIRAGEGQTVEFKRSLGQRGRALEALCGMLNANGGKALVIFGVGPDGEVCGIEAGNLDSAQRSLSRSIDNNIEPVLRPELSVADLDGKKLVLLSAARPRDVACYECKGRAYIRVGSETLRMSLAERQALTRRRSRASHPGPWRCDRCGSFVGMIASYSFTDAGPVQTFVCECGGELWPA
jgi:predicted HTH transcriptional regulator